MSLEAAGNERASAFILNQENSQNKFDPSKLPTSELTQLWTIAAHRGMDKLCSKIEDEKMNRRNIK